MARQNTVFMQISDEMDQFYNDLTGDMPGAESDPFEFDDEQFSYHCKTGH